MGWKSGQKRFRTQKTQTIQNIERKMYKYITSLEIEGHSAYIKKLILKDMKDKKLI